MSRVAHLFAVVTITVATIVTVAPGVIAHEERESHFPDGSGAVPEYRSLEDAAAHLVVCKDDSDERIDRIADAELRAFNEQLLGECEFDHIQEAVDAVTERGTNIYVLPGLYLEEPTRPQPDCEEGREEPYEYEDQVECGSAINLVTITGDALDDEDDRCTDEPLCDLQLEGTGEGPEDVLVRGGFRDDGEWVKHNGIRADRADGIYIKGIAVELIRENAFYVHETDGYVLDDVLARFNDLYGILTFASDHGVIKHCETHHNGDSGIYPGSPADVNADNEETGELDRWAVEVFGCKSHHNALGHSGTAGNSIYLHDNEWYANGAGIVVDSFVPDHPGMPQDHLWVENNRIYANNSNYYVNVQEGGPCAEAETPSEVGYEDGVVCPAFPVPVGSGIVIAGGNHNFVENNEIYDNWRYGSFLIYVPASLRGEPQNEYDTSHHNHFVENRLGFHPTGAVQPNGIDFFWDDQGEGNCWQDNTSSATEDGSPTSNTPHLNSDPMTLPDCDSGGSQFPIANTIKQTQYASCATYDREDNPNPPGCDWMTSPEEPEGREEPGGGADDDTQGAPADDEDVAAGSGGDGTLAATGGPVVAIGLLGAALMGLAVGGRRLRVAAAR